MTLQIYVGRFTLPDTAVDFTINDGTAYPVSLTVAARYAYGYTGESDVQFLEHVQAVIRAADAAFGAATVTFDVATGLVTINFGTVTSVAWTDTDLRDLLGYTADLSGSSAYHATNQLRYIWRPSSGLSRYPGDLTQWWETTSTTKVIRSKTGETYTVKGSLTYGGEYAYDKLPKNDVVKSSSTTWQALETFWTDVVHQGQPFRCYPDRTLNSSTSFYPAIWAVDDEEEGLDSFREYADRSVDEYNGLWGVDFELWKFVE